MNPIQEFIHNEEFVNANKDSLMAAYILVDDIENKFYKLTKEVGIASGLKNMWAKRVAEMNNNGESALTAAYDEALATDEATLAAAAIEVVEEIKKVLIKLLKSHELVPPLTRDVIIQVCKHVKHRVPLSHPYWRTNNCIVNTVGQVLLGGEGLYDSELLWQKKSLVSNNGHMPDQRPGTGDLTSAELEQILETTEGSLGKENNVELTTRDIRLALYNIIEVRDNIAARGNREATYATIFRHKLKTAQDAAPSYLSFGYSEAIIMTDYEIGRYINTLINRVDDYLRTSSTEHTTTEDLLTDLIVHIDSFEFKFRQKSLAVLREFFKVLVSGGRLFMFNMVPEDEYPEFEPRLVAVDRIFDKIYTTKQTEEA